MNDIGKFYGISLFIQALSPPRYNDDTLFTYFLVPLMSGALTGPMILTDYLIHISNMQCMRKLNCLILSGLPLGT
jgi:hypothetical protein